MTVKTSIRQFLAVLARRRRRYQVGLLARDLLAIAGYGVVALTAYVVADYFLAFSPRTLAALNVTGLSVLGLAVVGGLFRALRVSARRVAVQSDTTLANRRQDILSAHDLARTYLKTDARGLGAYLVETAVRRARERLQGMRFTQGLPVSALRRTARTFAMQVIAAVLLLGIFHNVSRIILIRILHPNRDLPPYSRYHFKVNPSDPSVLYGGSAEVGVQISGDTVRGTVWLLTRGKNEIHRTACFAENGQVYAQRLDQVVEPVQFAFATGRARSKWHTVNVMLEPKIAVARLSATPPAYSGEPAYSFFAGDRELKELKSSDITLEVTSNRPLSGGELRLLPQGDAADIQVVAAEKVGLHTVRFHWTLEQSADIEVSIQDIQGTHNQQPFTLKQKLRPDQPPRVVLSKPPAFSLATPRAQLTLAGSASDDIGLRSVNLVRSLVGYRDRPASLGPVEAVPRFDIEEPLDLGALGTAPGQVLEFYMEASDVNPDMTGLGASEIHRVEIIAEEEYAEMLRTRIFAEEFLARFREAQRTMTEARKLTEEILKQVEEGTLDETEAQKRLEELAATFAEAARTLREMSEDFPVFDAETELMELLKKMAGSMGEQAESLGQCQAGDPDLAETLQEALAAVSQYQQDMQEQVEKAELITEAARVIELASEFMRIYRAQEQLVRSLDRFSSPDEMRDERLFRILNERETEIRERLITFRDTLIERANALPDEFKQLRIDAHEFARNIDGLEIPEILNRAVNASKNEKAHETHDAMTLALERMEELLSDSSNCIGGMCQGNEPRFSVPKDMAKTLSQMIQAWCRPGQGSGSGNGRGFGAGGAGLYGSGEDGYSMYGISPLNMPMFGPGRASYMTGSSTGRGEGGGDGQGGQVLDESSSERMTITNPLDLERGPLQMESVPDKYRNALKKYFGIKESP